MKRLFLASSINKTAGDIAKKLGKDPKTLRTAFITTAAEVEDPNDIEWLENDKKGLLDAGFDLFEYTLTGKSAEQIESDLGNCDVIHVNGGNTFYLLLQARKSGFDKFIKNFIEKEGIYIGSSAGSIITSPNIHISRKIESKVYEEELKTFEGFNLVDIITMPHWASDYFRGLYLDHRIKEMYVSGNKIILLTDSQYVLVEDNMYRIIDIDD